MIPKKCHKITQVSCRLTYTHKKGIPILDWSHFKLIKQRMLQMALREVESNLSNIDDILQSDAMLLRE